MPRRPLNGSRQITGDAASHAAYGVGPATDYAAGRGTPVYSPFEGFIDTWVSGTGGPTIRVSTSDTRFIAQHFASTFDGGGRLPESTFLGTLSDTGSMWDGYHLHCWIEVLGDNGWVRMTFEHWWGLIGGTETLYGGWTSGSNPASAGSKPIPEKKKEEDTTVIQIKIDDSEKRLGSVHTTYFALVGEGIPWAPYEDARRANNYAAYVGKPAAIPCTYADWDYYKSISPA